MLTALFALATLIIGYDMSVTHRRVTKYGPNAELNPLTRYLFQEVGVLNGILAGIGVPHLLFSLVALQFGWTTAYAFYTGWLGKQFVLTLASLSVERELDELRARSAAPPQPGAENPTGPSDQND